MIPALLPPAVVSEALLVCFPPAIDVSIEVVDPPPAWMEVEWPPPQLSELGLRVWPARLPSLDVIPIAGVAGTFLPAYLPLS